MGRLIIAVLLASTTAVPALAQDREIYGGRHRERAVYSGQDAGGDAPARAEQRAQRRAERVEQRVERNTQQEEVQSSSAAPAHRDTRSSGSHRGYHRDINREHRDIHASNPSRREHRESHRDLNRDHRTEHRSWDRDSRRLGHGEYHRVVRQDHGQLHASNPTGAEHRAGHRQLSRQHDRRHSAWDTSWRSNRSYDWRGYRSRYGSLYDLSPYYDPYGYRYRNFSIGFNLWPSYYGSQFWLHDPWRYRLPATYGPYRWVRYYDDALLVNIYTGQVVDVERNFFW